MAIVSMKGRIDMHCHVAPSLFQRLYDDFGLARMAAAQGFGAVVLKDHFEGTVGRAYHANREVDGIQVFGGIVLNRYIGGINPLAVEAALAMGAKVIWMPTIDSANHARFYGQTFGYKGDIGTPIGVYIETLKHPEKLVRKTGISLLQDGGLTPEAQEVIGLVQSYDAVLASSHISKEELIAVLKYARGIGGVKVIVNHPEFEVPNYNVQDMKELIELGAIIEFCASMALRGVSPWTIQQTKEAMLEVGPEHCIISGDTGSPYQPAGPEIVRSYIQQLYYAGFPLDALDVMTIDNPRRLLNL